MDRRTFISAAGATGVTACTSGAVKTVEIAAASPARKPFVLVHGAWHGGWCWRYVRKNLQTAGHEVFTPSLTGLGDRAHLYHRNVNLTTHKEDIVNLIEREEKNDVILVGHSYAGYVVTLVADAIKDRLDRIIYLDAGVPKEGRAFTPSAQQEGVAKKFGEDGLIPVPGLDFFGVPETHEKADWLKRNLTPHPLATIIEPVRFKNNGAKGVPKTFIRCTGSPRYKNDPVKDIVKSAPDEWRYRVIDTGHDAMVTAPSVLSEMLLGEALVSSTLG